MPSRFLRLSVKVVMATGTFWLDSVRFWAVTTTSDTLAAEAALVSWKVCTGAWLRSVCTVPGCGPPVRGDGGRPWAGLACGRPGCGAGWAWATCFPWAGTAGVEATCACAEEAAARAATAHVLTSQTLTFNIPSL